MFVNGMYELPLPYSMVHLHIISGITRSVSISTTAYGNISHIVKIQYHNNAIMQC